LLLRWLSVALPAPRIETSNNTKLEISGFDTALAPEGRCQCTGWEEHSVL